MAASRRPEGFPPRRSVCTSARSPTWSSAITIPITLNASLFPEARFHDFWAIYQDDRWDDRDADGFQVSPAVRLMATPGHTAQDISTLADTDSGLVVLTHLWWHADGPQDDPLAQDLDLLHANRDKVLALRPSLIIPGHGAPFAPTFA